MDDVLAEFMSLTKKTNVCGTIKQCDIFIWLGLSGWWLNWWCLVVPEKDNDASQSDVELEEGQL